jgi:hypothetical protein
MSIAIDASAVDTTIPKAGIPRPLRRSKRSGNSPSFAAARGISAVIIVQPLSAPMPEMTTAAAMTLPQKVPPNIELMAVEKGALESASVLAGTIPKTATSDSM